MQAKYFTSCASQITTSRSSPFLIRIYMRPYSISNFRVQWLKRFICTKIPYFISTSRPYLGHASINIPADALTAALFLGGIGTDKVPESIGKPSTVCSSSHLTVFGALKGVPVNKPLVRSCTCESLTFIDTVVVVPLTALVQSCV